MQGQAQDADDDQVGRVVEVEEPLHALPLPPLAVVLSEDREGKGGAHLQQPVELVDEEEVHQGVDGRPKHDVPGLELEVAPVDVQVEGAHGRDAGPVRREGDDGDRHGDEELGPLGELLVFTDDHDDHRPGVGPHDAGLVEYAGLKGHEGDAEGEIVSKVGHQGKQEQPPGVLLEIVGVVAALGDEEPHDGGGEAADHVEGEDVPHRLGAGEKGPGQVVDGHGHDGDELDLVAVESFLRVHFCIIPTYSTALVAAMAPSAQAVTTCLRGVSRTSPAAKTPGTLVCMYLSVTMKPPSSRCT